MLTDLMAGSGDGGLSYTYTLSTKREHIDKSSHLSHISSQYHEVCGCYGATNQDHCFHNYIHIVVSLWSIKLDHND